MSIIKLIKVHPICPLCATVGTKNIWSDSKEKYYNLKCIECSLYFMFYIVMYKNMPVIYNTYSCPLLTSRR